MTTSPAKKCSIDDVKALARAEIDRLKAEKKMDEEKKEASRNACKTDASWNELRNINDRIEIHDENIRAIQGIILGEFNDFVENFAAHGMSCKEIVDLCVQIDGWAKDAYY